jgi:hypothetical protein
MAALVSIDLASGGAVLKQFLPPQLLADVLKTAEHLRDLTRFYAKFVNFPDSGLSLLKLAKSAYAQILPRGYPQLDVQAFEVQLSQQPSHGTPYSLSRVDQLSPFDEKSLGLFRDAQYLLDGERYDPSLTLAEYSSTPSHRLDCMMFATLLKEFLESERKKIKVDLIFARNGLVGNGLEHFTGFANCFIGHVYVVFNDMAVSLLPGGVQKLPMSEFSKIPQMLMCGVFEEILGHLKDREEKCAKIVAKYDSLPPAEKPAQSQKFADNLKREQESLDRAVGAFDLYYRAVIHGSGVHEPQLLSKARDWQRVRQEMFSRY